MLKNKNKIVASLLGAAALSTSVLAANYGVGLQNNQWQLIGVTGYHQNSATVTTSGAVTATTQCVGVACMDIGGVLSGTTVPDMVLIDLKDSANTVTWDANSSRGNATSNSDKNGYTAAANDSTATSTKLFTTSGIPAATPAVTYENNGSTTGSSDHSIVGLQTLNTSTSTLGRTAISFIYDSAVNIKSYATPMRTMYLKSSKASSTGAPDVKVIYQSSMEGQSFKMQFGTSSSAVDTSSSRTSNPFVWTSTTTTDAVYEGTFGQNYTWDTPASIGNGLTMSSAPGSSGSSSSTTTYTDYRNIADVFDQNLTDNNNTGYFDPTAAGSKRAMLEGNLTVYEYKYNADGTVGWDSSWFYRTSQSGVTSDAANEIVGSDGVKDNLTAGKGYWVKFDEWNGATMATDYDGDGKPSIPGLLVSDKISSGSEAARAASASGTSQLSRTYSSDIVKPGWNLLSFDSDTLRYSTTGIGITATTLAGDWKLIGPYGERVYDFDALAGATTIAGAKVNCQQFNRAIDGNNTVAGSYGNSQHGINDFNIRCYPVQKAGVPYALLISDKAFSIDVVKANTANVTTLAGVNYSSKAGSTTGHDLNITYVSGVPKITPDSSTYYRFHSRYGEYALALTLNPKLNGDAHLAASSTIEIKLPTFETSAGSTATGTYNYTTAGVNLTTATKDINDSVASVLSSASAVTYSTDIYLAADSACGTAGKCGTVWEVPDSIAKTGADGNHSVIIAMNKRFYVQDKTFIRTFDVSTPALTYGFGAKITGGGGYDVANLGVQAAAETGNTGGLILCDQLVTNGVFTLSAGSEKVYAYCINGSTETNNSVFFITDELSNYDVLEANVSNTSGTPATSDTEIATSTFYSSIDVFTEKTAAASFGNEANESVNGAIQSVYRGTALATAALPAFHATAPTINPTAITSNATYTPIWAEDFPSDGPLYTLTAISDGASGYLKPEVILTAVTSSDGTTTATTTGAVISWKAIDVTRDPKEWFDDANHFDLFNTESGRGYWVYATAGYKNPVTAETPTYTMTSFHHFNNKPDSNYRSVTTNSADGLLTVKVGGLYRKGATTNYTSGASFNVDLKLGTGNKMSMLTDTILAAGSTANFTIPLNTFETAGLESLSSTNIEGNVTAVDGLGGKATAALTLAYLKPGAPSLAASGSSIAITSTNSKYVYVFENNISDTTYASQIKFEQAAVDGVTTFDTATGDFVTSFSVPAAVTAPTTLTGSSSASSPVVDLRFVAATDAKSKIASTSPVFLSDQYQYKFAPITAKTHVLEATGVDTVDEDPKRYDQTNTAPTGTDSGVSLKSAVAGKVAIAYPPHTSSKLSEGFTHTIHIGTSTEYFGLLTYTPSYEGKYFFVNYETATSNVMYWGVFPNTGADGSGSGVTTNGGVGGAYQLVEIVGSTQKITK